jgi:membrane fusion protein (multidrug efflux system)
MTWRGWIASGVLLLGIGGGAAALARWKKESIDAANAAAAQMPEPSDAVTVAVAKSRLDTRTTTAVGTVAALRSITLLNELAGTVREVALPPGQVVEAGTLLVALDVSVEEAELAAQKAQVALAESVLARTQKASETHGASEMDVDRARAERDVTAAQASRIEAIVARKTLRAPFKARVGLSDLHVGQYLREGTEITTLQGVDEAVHVDFTVSQAVGATLKPGDVVDVLPSNDAAAAPTSAAIVALDALVDPRTRNAAVRAKVEHGAPFKPGQSVRVVVPIGGPREVVTVPVTALRRGPDGDHVFVVASAADGKLRAHARKVQSGRLLVDEIVVLEGLKVGETVAASGSFKLRDGELVTVQDEDAHGATDGH